MADEATTTDATADQTSADNAPESTTTAPEASATDTGSDEALGDAGKKALDAMKAKWKAAEQAAKERDAKIAELEAKINGTEADHRAAQEAQRLKDEALAAANQRILKAEVRAAAKGKVADEALADLPALMNLSDLEVGSDGEVDASQIASAIDSLIQSKPYLAAQGGRFQGSADGGARNDSTQVSQLTRADMARMSPEQIADAEIKGQFDDLLGRK
jgi:hypothetical protein